MEGEVSPVSKDDVAEVLRRRFFKPESMQNHDAFRPHVARAVGNIADMDEQTRRGKANRRRSFSGQLPFPTPT